jgi:preprotein translocase subunit SecD
MVVNGGPGGCAAARDGYFGVNVADIPSNNLKFGIDIQGGVQSTYKPVQALASDQINNIVKILNKRIQLINLPESKTYSSDGEIKIVSLSSESIGTLVMPGNFEATIMREVRFDNGVGEFGAGNNTYSMNLVNNSLVSVNNTNYGVDQSFYLDNIKFHLLNITNTSASIEATIFTNDDILQILQSYVFVKYDSTSQKYEYSVPVQISSDASDRFVAITKKLPTIYVSGTATLEGSLIYYLDGVVLNKLGIPFDMMGKKLDNISIVGFKKTAEEATSEKNDVEVAVSGVLPSELKMTDAQYFNPASREKIILATSILVAATIIFTIVFSQIRYKKVKLGGLIILLVGTEAIFVLGMAEIVQAFYGAGWIFDPSSVAGLLTLVAFGSVQMLFMAEKSLNKRDFGIYMSHKKIFSTPTLLNFAVFIFAFSMLFFLKGFGLALTIGLIFGLIAKSIFGDFLKK